MYKKELLAVYDQLAITTYILFLFLLSIFYVQMSLNVYFNLVTTLNFVYFYIILPLSDLLTYKLYPPNFYLHLIPESSDH